MIYDVVFTEKAAADLRGIYEYIAFELLEPEYAAGQIARIEQKIMQLEKFPEKFKQCEIEPWKSRNMRITSVDNYVIFYTPIKEKFQVVINRIMYSGRDYIKQLEEADS